MTQDDPYTDPATGVLLNLLGIADRPTLIEVERDLAFLRDQSLRRRPPPGSFDFAHLCDYHRHLFGDIYAWAGTPRHVDIARDVSPFAHWRYIEQSLTSLLAALRKEKLLADLDRADFLDRFTFYFVEVNVIHPFREGNGRTQRAFFRHLAAHVGWDMDISRVTGERYIEGCKAGMVGDLRPLTDLFDTVLRWY
ncbi:cell filamentation protein [Actinokineospora alba]|uniref:protein adenylyltransferase n=1 Tax=Actinokineospora alba TaxID=504798 RepID=A0A1H0WHV0_9PSEU|nr:Fic family protein [Actinokineospora alba]TDP65328.1 cell filamentation protein [Actinokineospora alba]SDH59800.1 cell filamentation protein [Actinokineospora alba]SDP89856.1 cell filamentation protein [Actinokineospora alba]